MIIDLNNNVWSFGWNESGQLGLGDNMYRQTPVKLSGIKSRFVSCGYSHTMIILSSNPEYLISFDEVYSKLDASDPLKFKIIDEYQSIKHNSQNCIASFHDIETGNIYLAELQHDRTINRILPPL